MSRLYGSLGDKRLRTSKSKASCNELQKKKTKLAWGSYRTRAAMVPVLLYSKTKKVD